MVTFGVTQTNRYMRGEGIFHALDTNRVVHGAVWPIFVAVSTPHQMFQFPKNLSHCRA